MQLKLNKDEIIIMQKKDTLIKCIDGILYITQEKDKKDYILEPGDEFKIKSRKKVYIHAMDLSFISMDYCKNKASIKVGANHFEEKRFSICQPVNLAAG